MTYQSFNRAIAEDILDSDAFDVVICDEAHRTLGETTSRNIQSFIQDKVAIGLTATSEYGENKKVDQLFAELIHKSEFRDAIDQGILAPLPVLGI